MTKKGLSGQTLYRGFCKSKFISAYKSFEMDITTYIKFYNAGFAYK